MAVVQDIDGNNYNSIVIGNQEWLLENLRTSRYADGSIIPYVFSAYEWQFGRGSIPDAYGALYNKLAATYNNEGVTICPAGWHLPNNEEFDTLRLYVGITISGGELKSALPIYWDPPNTGATNNYHFNAIGAGRRTSNGNFYDNKRLTAYWGIVNALVLWYDNVESGLGSFVDNTGLSVRLLKDDSNDPGAVTDIDGNVYATVKIGDQVWMAQNLRVEHYNDGTPITVVTDNTTWAALTTEAMCFYGNPTGEMDGFQCYYNNQLANANTYGVLYNQYAVNHGNVVAGADLAYITRGGVKQEGWRVPSQADWQELSTFLGGDSVAGGKLKEAGLDHWADPNTDADNSSLFTALPGGYRGATGIFILIEIICYLHTSLLNLARWLLYDSGQFYTDDETDQRSGLSVRLVRPVPTDPELPLPVSLSSQDVDFNDPFNVQFSIGDVRNTSFGSNNKTYTLTLPLTNKNKKFLKFINEVAVKSEPNAIAYLYKYESLVIYGKLFVLSNTELQAKIIISADDWMDTLSNTKLTALNTTTEDFVFSVAGVQNSWTAALGASHRYPMIDFGALMSGESGPTANWMATDFIPMIGIYYLINKILAPYFIISDWLESEEVKNLYILANEKVADEASVSARGLDVSVSDTTDNQATGSSSTLMMVTLNKNIVFNTETLDEANAFAVDTYTIPEAGTYRFQASIKFINTADGNASLTINDEQVTLDILKNSISVIGTVSAAYSGIELINGVTYSLDTGFFHCEAGDIITVNCLARCYVTILSGTQTVTISTSTLTNATFKSVAGMSNKYVGIGDAVVLSSLLPDMTQLDFLAALRDIFNLRFIMDKSKGTIYIEPWDQLLTEEVLDLTNMIDFKSPEPECELISQHYNKNIVLKWKDDSADYAFTDYLTRNTYAPGRKDLILESLFTKSGIDEKEHQFSTIITGYNPVIAEYNTKVPRIYSEQPIAPYPEYNRLNGFNTRLVKWAGLTEGYNWTFESTAQISYPKIEGLSWLQIYTDYWQRFFHYVDKGKLFTFKMKIKPGYLTQFMTKVNDETKEAFRPTYLITIKGEDHYFFMQKIVSDGDSAQIELILKQ